MSIKFTGEELNVYGKSIGIERYQGLGMPESDETYQKNIQEYLDSNNVSTKINSNTCQFLSKKPSLKKIQSTISNEIFYNNTDVMYAVFVVDPMSGEIIRISAKYHGGLALFDSLQLAELEANRWNIVDTLSSYVYEARPISLFEKLS